MAHQLDRLPDAEVLPFEGKFVVPGEAADAVAVIYPAESADWEEEAWVLVEEQRRRHAARKAARLQVEAARIAPRATLADYGALASLDEHQAEAVAAMTAPGLPGFALFDEQGTGKTIAALAAFERLRELGVVGRLLTVAPKSVIGSWQDDVAKFFGSKYRVVVAIGTGSERRHQLRRPHDILLTSYEGVVRDRVSLEALLSAEPDRYMLVVDESYFAKNPGTRRSTALEALRPYCERAVILCGTPAPNRAVDLINQLVLSQPSLAPARRALPRDREEGRRLARRTLDGAFVLRRLKEHVLPDLPPKHFDRVAVELAPEQRARYEAARDDLVLAVRSSDDRTFLRDLPNFLGRRAALLQICSHPGVFDSEYTETPAKLAALDALIGKIVQGGGRKLVVWSFYRYTLAAIVERFADLGIVRIDGSVSSARTRSAAVRRFQEDPTVKIFLGNPAAAGAGITLTAAHDVVFESFSVQAAHFFQSVDRVHRRGQTRDVHYYVLLAQDTIEHFEFDRLLEKEQASRELLRDRSEPPLVRERFLAELLGE